MEQEHKNLKPLLLAAVAAVTVVAILLVFFFSGRKSASSQTIVLPEPPAPEQTESEQQPQTSLASVSRENVQNILQKSVSRPSSYHQSMQIVITSGDVQRTQTAELWVNGVSCGRIASLPYVFETAGKFRDGRNDLRVEVIPNNAYRERDPYSGWLALPPMGWVGPLRIAKGARKA